jgi:hypothetical protein
MLLPGAQFDVNQTPASGLRNRLAELMVLL